MKYLAIPLLIILTINTYAVTEETKRCSADDALPHSKLTGSVQFGGVDSTGNTNELNVNGKASLKYRRDQWTTWGFFSALYEDDRDAEDIDEVYELFGQTQYNFTKKNYVYVNSDYLDDSDDGYDYIWGSSVGFGTNIFQTDDCRMWLDIQAGPGYRFSPSDDDALEDHQITFNGALKYHWEIVKRLVFEETLSASYAASDTIFTSNTTITWNVYKQFDLQFGVKVKHDTDVPEDSENTDTITTLNVVYRF